MTALEVLMKGDVINGLSVWDWMDWMFAEKPTLNWISDVEPECLNGCAGGLVSSLLPHCVHARAHSHTHPHTCTLKEFIYACLNALKRKWTVTHSVNWICKLPNASVEFMSFNSLSFYSLFSFISPSLHIKSSHLPHSFTALFCDADFLFLPPSDLVNGLVSLMNSNISSPVNLVSL